MTDFRIQQEEATSLNGGYEWMCPYCGKSRLNRSSDGGGMENAIAALRTHIMASGGEEHGPRYEFPAGEPPPFAEHVVKVDEAQ